AAFQPGTGRFFINDVGQSAWEEINEGAAGRNFGWPLTEGTFSASQYPDFSPPLYSYSHANGVAITGGDFYDPAEQRFPTQYASDYFFADFGLGGIRVLDLATMTAETFATGLAFPTNLTVSPTGDLYYLSRGAGTGGPAAGTGQVYKVQYSAAAAPTISAAPADVLASVGQPASFAVQASGVGPFAYRWQRDEVDIPGATEASFALPQVSLADSGARFRVVVTNPLGSTTSSAATLTVTTDLPPSVAIEPPASGATYFAGQTIRLTGLASDPEVGDLEGSQYVWQVEFHHHTHSHPFLQPTSGTRELEFTIPTDGETSDDVWYRVYLTVTDRVGLSTTTTLDLRPVTAELTLPASAAGLVLLLDGQPQSLPLVIAGVAGLKRTLEAPQAQTIAGVDYAFQGWSDGGPAKRELSFPASDTTLTPQYLAVPVTYLSDLPFSGTPTNGWGTVERDQSNGEKPAGDGNPLTLAGVRYAKGLGVHSYSSISFALGGKYARFLTDIGIDDEVGTRGRARFQVWGDGKLLYERTKTGADFTSSISLDVNGIQTLKLIVTDGGDGIAYDHADWAGARLMTSESWAIFAPLFDPPTSLPTGSQAHGVVSGDWNRDGRPDLAVANAGASTISILLGRGDGNFDPIANYEVAAQPKALATADLNGDRHPDLVVVSQQAGRISVLLGRGDGTFAPPVVYAGPSGSHDVAWADFDGDRDIDIAVVGWGAKVVRVLMNRGNGTFTSARDYAVGSAPHSVVAADLNGDKRPDLAVANRDSSNVAVLLNQGQGRFGGASYFKVGKQPHSVKAGDLNGDGRLDLVTANEGSANVSLLLNTGSGKFATAVHYATGSVPKGVALGDLNGDGRLDVVTANTAGNYPHGNNPGGDTISVLLGIGKGKLARPQTYRTGRTPFSIALADFDQDGDLDLATANWHTHDTAVLLNRTKRRG
ncbi:MAG: FG-GAP-like repeat-containing protein, partial [Pirellulaceae bacterium]|nr:FG-GAP-like repeat-containing protein [Pirellulaceae bacterium]